MLKKLLLAIATVMATMSFSFADVDVNKADQAALDGVKGIGPTMSRSILAERKKGGDFKDWSDLQSRVKGIGEKNSEKFSQAGLTVGGMAKPDTKGAGSAPPPSAKSGASKSAVKQKAAEPKKSDKPAKS